MDRGNREQRYRCSGPPTCPQETRWRRSQRRRRGRHLTARGCATLVALSAAALIAVFWGAGPSGPPGTARALAPVSAAPPPLRRPPALPASVRLDTAPAEVFQRLPFTQEALAMGDTNDLPQAAEDDGYAPGLLYELLPVPHPAYGGPLRVEYTLDAELTRRVFRTLRRARVKLGHVILLDPASGRVLAYASTDAARFPPTRAYPAASLIKVITAAAALHRDPDTARLPCRFRGSPYRLTPSRIDPPKRGRTVSLRRALATSNNQCFAQLAVHAVGEPALVDAIARFGWLVTPGPAHAAGSVDPGEDRIGLGRLGCGLSGCRITPLHAAQLAATLAGGELVWPRWIHRVVNGEGRELRLPAPPPPREVMSAKLSAELRSMLVDTTVKGTARSAFRKRNGRPLLGPVRVAGKTGSLSGTEPTGRYEWFIGVAPADRPRVAVAVLLVQGHLWWRNASQVGADVLQAVLCSKGACEAETAERWLRPRAARETFRPALSSADTRKE